MIISITEVVGIRIELLKTLKKPSRIVIDVIHVTGPQRVPRYLVDDMNMSVSKLRAAHGCPQCRWISPNAWKASIIQKAPGREMSPALGHWPSPAFTLMLRREIIH